jgi:hypothetical protein
MGAPNIFESCRLCHSSQCSKKGLAWGIYSSLRFQKRRFRPVKARNHLLVCKLLELFHRLEISRMRRCKEISPSPLRSTTLRRRGARYWGARPWGVRHRSLAARDVAARGFTEGELVRDDVAKAALATLRSVNRDQSA